MRLSYDVSRCNGNGSQICQNCARRIVPGWPKDQNYFTWPMAKDDDCRNFIDFTREGEYGERA